LQNKAQTFIDGSPQARRHRAGVLRQETKVERRELRDIHDRVARQAGRARWQQDVAGHIGKFRLSGVLFEDLNCARCNAPSTYAGRRE
jgi:hypothetical protein